MADSRWNEDQWARELRSDVWLTEYDKYVIMSKLSIEIITLKSNRDKCGISESDMQAEQNKHIASLRKLAKQLDIELVE